MKSKSEIFISYRRDGGEFAAKKLRDVLVKAHYHAFLDIEGLGSGDFNEHLLEAIDSSSDYILVLSKNCLDRCVNEDDWVRREIEYAHSKNKHIIALVNKEFAFPENLPESCKFLTSTEVEKIEYDNLDDIPILLGTIRKSLTAPCHKFEIITNRVLPIVAAVLFVALVSVIVRTAVIKTKQKFPKTKADEVLIGEVLEYVDSNLSAMDEVLAEYSDVMDSCLYAAENYPAVDLAVPIEKFENLYGYLNFLDTNNYALNPEVSEKLTESNFSKEDVLFLNSDFETIKEFIIKNIANIAEPFYYETEPDNQIIPSNKKYYTYLKEEMLALKDQTLIYVNGILNPISKNYKPFIDFKNNVLTKYKVYNFADYKWLSNTEIEALFKEAISEAEGDISELQGKLNSEADNFDFFLSDEILENLLDSGFSKEGAEQWFARQAEISAKKRELTEKRLKVVLSKYKLKQLLIYSEEDNEDILFNKANAAYSNQFYDVTEYDLAIMEEKFPDSMEGISYINKNFPLFKKIYKTINYNGILFVTAFHGSSEYQKYFNLGDIIISVDNKPFLNFDEFAALRAGKTATLQVLQNNGQSLVLKNITCQGTLGLQLIGFTGK